jgi:hypothetical protein
MMLAAAKGGLKSTLANRILKGTASVEAVPLQNSYF